MKNGDHVTLCKPESLVQGVVQAIVLFRNHLADVDPEAVYNIKRAVGRTAINDDVFLAGIVLRRDRAYRVFDGFRRVIGDSYDREFQDFSARANSMSDANM